MSNGMLSKLGFRKKYITLLCFRVPFEAVRTIVNAVFLQQSFTAIELLDAKKLGLACLLFFVECAFLFSYNGTVWQFFGAMYARLKGSLSKRMMQSLIAKPFEELETLSSGDILVRFNNDADKAAAMYGEPFNLVFLLNGLCNIIISSVLFLRVSPRLFLLVLAFVIPHVALSICVISPLQYRIQGKIQAKTAELTDLFTSYIAMEDIVRLYDAAGFLKAKMDARNEELRRLNVKKAVYSAIGDMLLPLFGLSGYLVLMLTGGSMVAAGTLTYATLLYVCQLRGGILPASFMVINSALTMKTNSVSLKRIEPLL